MHILENKNFQKTFKTKKIIIQIFLSRKNKTFSSKENVFEYKMLIAAQIRGRTCHQVWLASWGVLLLWNPCLKGVSAQWNNLLCPCHPWEGVRERVPPQGVVLGKAGLGWRADRHETGLCLTIRTYHVKDVHCLSESLYSKQFI